MERFECYHGTSQEAGNSILSKKHFDPSSEEDDWAGSGIYYFIDSPAKEKPAAYKNAKYWAKYKKRFFPQVILRSTVCIDEDKLLDLHNEYYQEQFHRFRVELFELALAIAKKQGVHLKSKYLDPGKLDCVTINEMCGKGEFAAVIRQAYIPCLSYPRNRSCRYPNSFIPNCTIFCLRDESFISDTIRV